MLFLKLYPYTLQTPLPNGQTIGEGVFPFQNNSLHMQLIHLKMSIRGPKGQQKGQILKNFRTRDGWFPIALKDSPLIYRINYVNSGV